MRTFVDTSGFYALADRSDRHHIAARRTLEARRADEEWITTDHVIVESWLLLRGRLGYAAALKLWDALAAGLATVAGLSSEDWMAARRIVDEWRDQELSLVDGTSFAFMARVGLERALAFDLHFELYRYGPGRRRRWRLVGR